MFKTKNLSAQYLALLATVLISFFFSILIFFVSNYNIRVTLISFLSSSLCLFFFLRYIFNWFIFRRIKNIYKLIYNTKANKKEEEYYKYILPQKSVAEVEKDVEGWASQHVLELEQQRTTEQYRKEFLQNLSHELKTPVFAIQGYIETLLDECESDFQRKFLSNANQNVERMRLLLKDLDEISSLESGEQPLVFAKFIIQDLIKEVFDSLTFELTKNNINAQIKKGCETPIQVSADKEKIRRVLINLVVNSAKYGKKDGNILAGVYRTDDENVLIEISDDGIGIENEHLNRVFERFYRTDTARSRKIGGSGLGLAICKHIIEAHRQTIHARSKPNVGTTIGFTLATK